MWLRVCEVIAGAEDKPINERVHVNVQKRSLYLTDAFRGMRSSVLNGANDVFKRNLCGVLLSCAIVAAALSGLVYHFLDISQSYAELIVGSVAWQYTSKFRDYAFLFTAVFGFVAVFLLTSAILDRLAKASGDHAVAAFDQLLLVLCAPAGFWFFALVISDNSSLSLLWISGSLVGLAMTFTSFLLLRKNLKDGPVLADPVTLVQDCLLTLVLVVFSAAAIGVFVSRFLPILGIQRLLKGEYVIWLSLTAFALTFIALLALILASSQISQAQSKIRSLLIFSQIPAPLFFFILIPNPWYAEGRIFQNYTISLWAYITVALCMAVHYWQICYSYKRSTPNHASQLALIPAMTYIAVIIFIKATPIGIPQVSHDDYHFGEFLTPWINWVDFGLLPYWDYAPARGMVNYLPGAFAAVFFENGVAAFYAATPFIYLLILLLSFPILSRTMGKGVSFLAFLIAPYINGMSEIDVIVTVFICFLVRRNLQMSPEKWLALSLVCALLLILFAPGQGGLAALSVMPLAAIMLWRFFVEFERRKLNFVIAAVVLLCLAALVTPLGKMLIGAFRYGLEQSSVNSIAHGKSWVDSFATSGHNPWLFEIIRSSWILVSIFAALTILRLAAQRKPVSSSALFFYAVPIFIITVLFIIRAAGRIDIGVTRLGIASIWAFAFLLPILLFAERTQPNQGRLVFFWVCLAGFFAPFGAYPTSILEMYDKKFNPVHVDSTSLRLMSEVEEEFPHVGRSLVEPEHLDRVRNIRNVLDRVLEDGETYLDMTNRGAHYYYSERRQPIETAAIYNLVTESQQSRAVTSLIEDAPPAILLSADNIIHDGGGASLRSYLLYRWVMLRPDYEVVHLEELVWLIRKDRIARLGGLEADGHQPTADNPERLVNDMFRVPYLANVPASWGRSQASLEHALFSAITSSPLEFVGAHSVQTIKSGRYRVVGEDPHVVFDISSLNVDGKDVGLIGFDFHCKRSFGPEPVIELYWSSGNLAHNESTAVRFAGREGRLLVPIDSTPSWLLTTDLQTLRFDLQDRTSCETFSLSNISLLQRTVVAGGKEK